MRLFMLLSVYYLATLGSDIAKVYPPGSEKAVAGGGLAVVAVNGKELASVANAGLAVTEVSGKEKSK